ELKGDAGFRELLGQVRHTVLEAHAHQDVPFEKLVEELQPERDMSRPSIFQVMLALQNIPAGKLQLGELRLSTFEPHSEPMAKFEISLDLIEDDGRIHGCFEYARDLFSPETMQRFSRHWQALLEGIVAEPERPVMQITLLSVAEKRQILEQWNAREAECGPESSPYELFARQARLRPEAFAVSFEGKRRTYAELEQRVRQLADYLASCGAGPEVPVGVCIERTQDIPLAMLAVFKAGGIYIPIDPFYPAERISYVLGDAQIEILLTHKTVVKFLPAYSGRVIQLDGEWDRNIERDAVSAVKQRFDEGGAYVIYTSGSTGKPKGVLVESGGITRHLYSLNSVYGVSSSDKVLLVASTVFDVSIAQTLLALCFGAQLEILPDFRSEGVDPIAFMADSCATVAEFPPALWMAFARSWPRLANSPARLVVVGGESVPAEGVQQWRQIVPDRIALVNSYGPTETIIECTEHYFPCRSEQPLEILIGHPLPARWLYVLDEYFEPQPVGVHGELFIGGSGVARGYLGRPELTAERFLPNPFGIPGSRMYRSGDLVCWRPDGTLKFIGRADHQVKIRGYRIELGEIEAVLAQHAGVREAAVIVRGGGAGKHLVACVVVDDAIRPDVDQLRAYIAGKLPDYMLPSGYVVVDKLPVNANGKIDRKKLATLEPDLGRAHGSVIARLLNPIEEILRGVWEEVLQRSPIQVKENFFELGGHSLLATQVVARISEAVGVEVPLRRLFEAPTIE
ncbi:MAG: amino acid adenylation domain-containing protein, partial [Candidatus Angelobacter sp.]